MSEDNLSNGLERIGQFKPEINEEDKPNRVYNLTLNDLAKLVLFKLGSISEFGKRLGLGRSRACQILKGYEIPKSPETIKKIAAILDIDPVILSQVFANASNKTTPLIENEK